MTVMSGSMAWVLPGLPSRPSLSEAASVGSTLFLSRVAGATVPALIERRTDEIDDRLAECCVAGATVPALIERN